MLPRTPNEAGLVPVKLKRKQSMKNIHLQEYININKIYRALHLLKTFGHKYYQFDVDNEEDYRERCLRDNNEGFETLYRDSDRDSTGSCSNDDKDVEIDTNVSNSDDHSEECDVDNDDVEIVKPEKSKAEVIQDEIVERENEEEHYLKNDATGKYMFEYNRTTCMSEDLPEIGIQDTPITISPGEGKISNFMNLKIDFKYSNIL